MVPPQFAAKGGLMGAKQPLELYRALPVQAYSSSARPLRKEFHTPATPPLTNRRLSGKRLGCVLIFINVFNMYICFCVCVTVYHHRRHKSTKNPQIFSGKIQMCLHGNIKKTSRNSRSGMLNLISQRRRTAERSDEHA